MSFDSVRGNQADAGAGAFGGHIQTAPANFQSHWSSAEDAMAASIIRLECQKDELNAEVALLREQARILTQEHDEALTVMRETRRRLDDAWLEIEQLKKDRELLKRQRDDAWKEIKRLTKGMEKWT